MFNIEPDIPSLKIKLIYICLAFSFDSYSGYMLLSRLTHVLSNLTETPEPENTHFKL